MAKSKITYRWDNDSRDRPILVLEKAKGKFTLDEITDYLLYDSRQYGKYAIIINASESACGGSGWGEEDRPGDIAILYEILERDNCPICGDTTPYQYCPECGNEF